MNYTLVDSIGALLAALAFAPFILAPGYLLTRLRPRQDVLEAPARLLLWSVVLGIASSLTLASVVGRMLPPLGLLLLNCAIAALAAARIATRDERSAGRLLRQHRGVLIALLALGLYLIFATSAVQVGPRLYEAVSASDWSIRVPLVGASLRNGVPPGNPFFTFAGHPQPARYYFYWYALCAEVGRPFHLSPRACLMGSTLWAGWGLAAALLLAFLHLVPHPPERRRPQVGLLLALCCVLGIDVIPATAGLLSHPFRFTPELEWWRDDRIPSFLSAIVFAPHHIAGLVCAVAGFLVLAVWTGRRSPGESTTGDAHPPSARAILSAGTISGVCFAATAGSSTYIAFCFAFIGALYGIDLLWHRRWSSLAALAIAAIVALGLSIPFLRSMLNTPALAEITPGTSTHFFRLAIRNAAEARHVVFYLAKHAHHPLSSQATSVAATLPFLALLGLEPGFLLIPFLIRAWADVRRVRAGESLTPGERLLWAIFLGALIPAVFISSEPTQGVNDLGRHAGLILRFALVLWAAPLVDRFLEERRTRRQQNRPRWPHPVLTAAAAILLALGLASQLWQIVVDRTFLVLAEANRFNPEMPFVADTDIAARYLDVRRGMDLLDRLLPQDAVIQSNPGSRYQMLSLLYSRRAFAAGDVSCVTAFGGSPALCLPMVARIEYLFGGPPDERFVSLGPLVTQIAPDAAQTTTIPAFVQTCRDLHLSVVIAEDSDPAWSFPNSWVWQTPLFGTPRVRFLPCPPR